MPYYRLIINGELVSIDITKLKKIAKVINTELPNVLMDIETYDKDPNPLPAKLTKTILSKDLIKEL